MLVLCYVGELSSAVNKKWVHCPLRTGILENLPKWESGRGNRAGDLQEQWRPRFDDICL